MSSAPQTRPAPAAAADGSQWSVGRLLGWTGEYFAKHGIERPAWEAELLLAHVLDCKRVELYFGHVHGAPVDDDHRAAFRELVRRRAQGCPVAYLVGHREFYSLPFAVTPAVLIPRPETERLVDEALKWLKERTAGSGPLASADTPPDAKVAEDDGTEMLPVRSLDDLTAAKEAQREIERADAEQAAADRTAAELAAADAADPRAAETDPDLPPPPGRVSPVRSFGRRSDGSAAGPKLEMLDIGTGSGCIAVTLLHECPTVHGVAVDVSEDALSVAARNAERHRVADRLQLLPSDLDAALPQGRRFDLIVGNPPYVAAADMDDLPPTVRDFEPSLALDGGTDGMEIVQRLLRLAPERLRPSGRLLVEIGADQKAAALAAAGEVQGLSEVAVLDDYSGRPRVLSAVRSSD